MTPLVILGGMLGLAATAPLAARRLGRNAGYPLAAGFAAAAGLLLTTAPTVARGTPVEVAITWLPRSGLGAALRVDGLSLLFALLVLIVGAAVMAYTARYLPPTTAPGALYGWLTMFAAAMFGLVVADDLILLVVFWELTSVSSFVLIAGRGEHRAAATRALVTTTAGGLALLAAATLITGGTGLTRLSEVVADPVAVRDSALAPAVIVLLIVAAATKSAQVPFHFWLPGAMVAPTPISTYLHAATMVKAGIYLLLRFTPVFGTVALWQVTLLVLGLTTALWGALLALKRHDLKAILAYSTISQLGLLVAVTGVGTPEATSAVGLLLLAHAAYKATWFMVVGVIDHQAHVRDIRELTGLRHDMPATAGIAALATLSMAGLPPVLGFGSKEAALAAMVAWPAAMPARQVVLAGAVTVSVLTVAYSARLLHGAFGGRRGAGVRRPSPSFIAPAAATAVAGLMAGVGMPLLEPLIDAFVIALHGAPAGGYLALWHGLTVELALSAAIVAAGAGLVAGRGAVQAVLQGTALPTGTHGVTAYDRLQDLTLRVGEVVARSAAVRAPSSYVAAALVTAVVAGTMFAAVIRPSLPPVQPTARAMDWVLVALIAAALALVVVTRDRLTAAVLLGVVGYAMALWFATLGAADLALTLILVETLFVTAIVLSIRSLPRPFLRQRARGSLPSVVLAACTGIVAGAATWSLTGRRPLSEPGAYFLEQAEEATGGTNVVNTVLVDFRALDTLGELIVVVVAVLGLSVIAGWTRRKRPT